MFYKISKVLREDYFGVALLLFMASFFILPTTKMVNNVYYALFALAAVFFCLYRRFDFYYKESGYLLWLLFLCLIFVSGLASSSDLQIYKHIFYVLVFVTISVFVARADFFFTTKFIRLAFWLVTLYVLGSAMVYWLTGKYEVGERVLWLPARMTGPIYTSMMISALFCLCLPVWVSTGKLVELVAALLVSLFNITFVVQSRSGLVSLFFVFFVYMIYLLVKSDNRKYALYVFAFLLLSPIVLWLLSDNVPVLEQIISRADAGRFELWRQVLTDFSNCNLLLGCGPDFESDRTILGTSPILHPHSVYLSVLVYTGLLPLLVFLVLCCLTLFYSYRQKNNWGLYLLSSMVAFNFDGSHIVGNPDEPWILLILPMVLILNREVRTKRNWPSAKAVLK